MYGVSEYGYLDRTQRRHLAINVDKNVFKLNGIEVKNPLVEVIYEKLNIITIENFDLDQKQDYVHKLEKVNAIIEANSETLFIVELNDIKFYDAIANNQDTKKFFQLITKNNVQRLEIKDCKLPLRCVKQLVINLKVMNYLKDLTISGCKLDDAKIQKLSELIKNNKYLRSIDLTRNEIGAAGFTALNDSISKSHLINVRLASKFEGIKDSNKTNSDAFRKAESSAKEKTARNRELMNNVINRYRFGMIGFALYLDRKHNKYSEAWDLIPMIGKFWNFNSVHLTPNQGIYSADSFITSTRKGLESVIEIFALSNFTLNEVVKLKELVGDACVSLKSLKLQDADYKKFSFTRDEASQIKEELAKINSSEAKNLIDKLVITNLTESKVNKRKLDDREICFLDEDFDQPRNRPKL